LRPINIRLKRLRTDIDSVHRVEETVKAVKRRYNSTQRAAQAAATRRAVLDAAGQVFVRRGYIGATVAEIAATAGVAVDTLYATVGSKPVLLRELVETAISGTDTAVPAEDRDYVRAVHAATSAEEKLRIYATAVVAIQHRLAPVFLALRDAAATDGECARLWTEISERRARNMRQFAVELRHTGQLRDDLSDEEVADVVWSMNAAEYWLLLVGQRGWTPERFGVWLVDAWNRLLLSPAAPAQHLDR
jgi:AcrR family transcriptional regulator